MNLIKIIKRDDKNMELESPLRKIVKDNSKDIEEGEKSGHISAIHI